jgi:hypothetical protein
MNFMSFRHGEKREFRTHFQIYRTGFSGFDKSINVVQTLAGDVQFRPCTRHQIRPLVLRVSSGGSNNSAHFEATVLNHCERFFEVVGFLAGLDLNMASACSVVFQNLVLYAIHVADHRFGTDALVEAFRQGAVAGEHHVRSLYQSPNDIIADPFSGGKHNARLTCHKGG